MGDQTENLERRRVRENERERERSLVSCCHEMLAKRDYRNFDNKVCLKTRE